MILRFFRKKKPPARAPARKKAKPVRKTPARARPQVRRSAPKRVRTATAPKPPAKPKPQGKILTAEGYKRLMQRKLSDLGSAGKSTKKRAK